MVPKATSQMRYIEGEPSAAYRRGALWIRALLFVFALCAVPSSVHGQTVPASESVAPQGVTGLATDSWNGYTRVTFQFEGRTCYVVMPKWNAAGKPWLWRARFWGHRPEVDLALLAQGYHLAYMDVAEMLGNEEAVNHWNDFYNLLTSTYGLNPMVELEAMSRGGLYAYAWAARNPEKIAAIYADAPVCDIKSWPLALRKGQPDPQGWKMVVKAFGFHDIRDAIAYDGNPIDVLEPLARHNVPLLHVIGDADTTVPPSENTRVLEERYQALGGPIQIIVKHGVGHVHGMDDPTPIIQFLTRHRPVPKSNGLMQ